MSPDTINSNNIKVVHKVAEVRAWHTEKKQQGMTIGYIPTMGALHNGHINLVHLAMKECECVIVSIFVNPAQFAPHEDLDQYPRTLAKDVERLQSESTKPILVFAPDVKEMYPRGITTHREKQEGTFIEVLGLSEMLEGKSRPNFFRGVATIVTKLFHITMPDYAYFGQKDIQQCCVIRAMISDLHFPITLRVGSTVREEDGLAMSSRNVYLTKEQRARAPAFHKGMTRAKTLFLNGTADRESIISVVKEEAEKAGLDIEYISLANPDDLSETETVGPKGAILSGAWRMGTTRLIDNTLIGFEF